MGFPCAVRAGYLCSAKPQGIFQCWYFLLWIRKRWITSNGCLKSQNCGRTKQDSEVELRWEKVIVGLKSEWNKLGRSKCPRTYQETEDGTEPQCWAAHTPCRGRTLYAFTYSPSALFSGSDYNEDQPSPLPQHLILTRECGLLTQHPAQRLAKYCSCVHCALFGCFSSSYPISAIYLQLDFLKWFVKLVSLKNFLATALQLFQSFSSTVLNNPQSHFTELAGFGGGEEGWPLKSSLEMTEGIA